MSAVRSFLSKIRKTGTRRAAVVRVVAMGRERIFRAWDVGADTFIVEKGVDRQLDQRPSVLIVRKDALRRGVEGRVMTLSGGNHSVAAFPLLDGRFWDLSRLPAARRGEVLTNDILCANVVNGALELSQRDVPARLLVADDCWLLDVCGFGLGDVVLLERTEQTLEHYRRLGQEWRVKPLAWTESEMRVALAASRRRIASPIRYCHSSRGVHFLTLPEFRAFASLAETDVAAFETGLRELVSIYEGHRASFARMPKHRGHHEIEFFGIRRGMALARLVPELEKLMEAIALGRIGQLGVIQRMQEAVALYESLLSRPEYSDETTPAFAEALYMCITGEIYAVAGEGTSPAFDDRRTALPGATFIDGRPVFHEGADGRSEVLLANLRALMSKDEQIEYANVYEIRDDASAPVGRGKTREIVFKSNRRPLETSLVEKRLSSGRKGYSSYMLARVGAFRALGVKLSADYRLLRRRAHRGHRPFDFYVRTRCEGDPMDSIPASYFSNADDASLEESRVVVALASLMGDAAAQNLAMKKYDPATKTPLYGVGKEIYEFEFDVQSQCVMPKAVRICSIRGSLGWPTLDESEENLAALNDFYLGAYARALADYASRHRVPLAELAEAFLAGFENRTRAMAWQLSVMRDQFEAFLPDLPRGYAFARKWRFAMWALDRQDRRLEGLRHLFLGKLAPLSDPNDTNQNEGEQKP